MTATCALPPNLEWKRLIQRSIAAWDTLAFAANNRRHALSRERLQNFACLDDMLQSADEFGGPFFWFFQTRDSFLSQRTMTKWSWARLQDYIILSAAPNYISQQDCFFLSHFWQTKLDPDPGGEYLRRNQEELRRQEWKYIWVDWTCTPQEPRTGPEEKYFFRSLEVVSRLVQNCAFMWHYPPFEPRLWILYEVAGFILTCSCDFVPSPDIKPYLDHVSEMTTIGVRQVLEKYCYRCSNEHDRLILTCWLELLVILKKLPISDISQRRIMDHVTWQSTVKRYWSQERFLLSLDKFEGRLSYGDRTWTFTPFPRYWHIEYVSRLKKE